MLELKIIRLTSPYEDETWGKIILSTYDKKIMEVECNYEPLIVWFLENESHIRDIPFFIADAKKNTAENIFNARNIPFEENFMNNSLVDDWYSEIFNFYSTHGIAMALRGVNVPDLIFSTQKNKSELSYFNEETSEAYSILFDIDSFFQAIHTRSIML